MTTPALPSGSHVVGDPTHVADHNALANAAAVAMYGSNNGSEITDAGTFRANAHIPVLTPAACVAAVNAPTLSGSGGATTIASGSNGVSLPQATINVASATAFPSSGTINVVTGAGTQAITYTGTTGTTFTGCLGGTGTMSTGGAVTATFDGYLLASSSGAQDTIFLTAQTTASQNGPWLIPVGLSGAWTRPTDFATGAVVKGRTVRVINGTNYANTDWTLVAPTAGITVDTSSQTWTNILGVTVNTRATNRAIGQAVINITDPKYGAVADSGTTDNTTAILAAITDAQSYRCPIYAPGSSGSYGFSGNTGSPSTGGTITFPDGVDLIGDGISKTAPATRFLCKSAASRLAFGYSGVGSGITFGANPVASGAVGTRGGRTGNFLVDGNSVATQPLFLARAETVHEPISVLNGAAQPAYNAGTAYTAGQRVLYLGFTFQCLTSSTGNTPTVTTWVTGAGAYPASSTYWQPVADSAGVVMQYGQNSKYHLLDIENCAGSAIVFDGGTGGHEIHMLEMNACGGSGAYMALITQSYLTASVYAQPSKITIKQAIFDRPSAGALGLLNVTACSDISFHDPVFSASGVTASLYAAVSMVYDGTHTCARLKLRDANVGLDATGSVAFAVASGCFFDHERTVISGGSAAYAYLIQNGANIEDERPVWPSSQAMLHPSSTGTLDGACAARHYAPIQGFSPTSGSPQWQISELGTAFLANLKVANGDIGGGSGGILAFANSTHAPTANPSVSIALWAVNGGLVSHSSNGSIGLVAGNWQVKSANYTMLAGDAGVLASAASASITITLPLATTTVNSGNQVGVGTEIVVRRTDNTGGNTFTVAANGADQIKLLGASAASTATIAVLQSLRFVSDGGGNWVQI